MTEKRAAQCFDHASRSVTFYTHKPNENEIFLEGCVAASAT